jgi:hypothetical protein
MHLSILLVLASLVAAALAVTFSSERAVPLIALVASTIEAVLRLHFISIATRGFPLSLALAAALVICGGIIWARAARKSLVTAATVITLTGALQAGSLLWL